MNRIIDKGKGWKDILISNALVIAENGKNYVIEFPEGSQYAGFVYQNSKRFTIYGPYFTSIRIHEDWMFKIYDVDRMKTITSDDLIVALIGASDIVESDLYGR